MITVWEEVFASLPDDAFFEVVRNYLGPVETPYHKPELVGRLSAFLRGTPAIETALALLNREDVRFLALIDITEDPTERELRDLFSGVPYPVFRERLLNLEERLLIWSRVKEGERRYALTPTGVAAAEAGYLGPVAVAEPGDEEEAEDGAATGWLDDGFLTVILALLMEGRTIFLKEGGLRKRAFEELAERLPSLFADRRGEDRLFLVGRALITSGLADRREEALVPKVSRWRRFAELSPESRLSVFISRAVAGRAIPAPAGGAVVQYLINGLPPRRPFVTEDLIVLLRALLWRDVRLSPAGAKRIIHHLELVGIFRRISGSRLIRTEYRPWKDRADEAPRAALTPSGDLTLLPGSAISLETALSMAPVVHDVAALFRIDRDAFLRGLDEGVDGPILQNAVSALTGHGFPANLRVMLNEWERDYRGVEMRQGVVFTAGEERRALIEGTGALKRFIRKTLAPGIWLLDPAEEAEWSAALEDIGIAKLPPIRDPSGQPVDSDTEPWGPGYPVDFPDQLEPTPWEGRPWVSPLREEAAPLLAGLKTALGKAGLNDGETKAMDERIDRKLILVADQFRPGAARLEVTSAKGLDYQGKVRLAEAALAGKNDRLEVSLPAGIDIEVHLVEPQKIEKEGDDHVLVGRLLPEDGPFRVKIRKIGFLKRIKASLF